MSNKKNVDNFTISTDEVLAYPEKRYAKCPRRKYSVGINLATPFPKSTAKFHQKESKADALVICPYNFESEQSPQFYHKYSEHKSIIKTKNAHSQ